MRAVVFYGVQDVRRAERPLPQPPAGQVRLHVTLAGMCATDRHIVAGHFAVRPPRVLGHELTGSVEALGPGVDPSWLGRACGVRPARFCGQCALCRTGRPQLCRNFTCLGNTHDGGFAEYTLVPVDQLIPLDGITPENAVWLEPLACVLQALEQAGGAAIAGPTLILGGGVLGQLMLLALRAQTTAPLAMIDPNPGKVAAALTHGAQAAWTAPREGPAPEAEAGLRAWAPDGPALVIDTSGAPAALRRAVAWAGAGGQVLLFGVSDPAAEVSLPPALIFGKELTLRASSGMTPASFDAALALVQQGRIDPRALGSVTIGLDDLPAHLLGQAPKLDRKLLVRPAAEAAL